MFIYQGFCNLELVQYIKKVTRFGCPWNSLQYCILYLPSSLQDTADRASLEVYLPSREKDDQCTKESPRMRITIYTYQLEKGLWWEGGALLRPPPPFFYIGLLGRYFLGYLKTTWTFFHPPLIFTSWWKLNRKEMGKWSQWWNFRTIHEGLRTE